MPSPQILQERPRVELSRLPEHSFEGVSVPSLALQAVPLPLAHESSVVEENGLQ